ncbi:hypothetical protein BSKO_01347 [Bryopsis sp. KO-2023]|nr:hypothetical protein BSKO_01347 [Bryopsis sp. KO-2023]
MVAAMEIYPTPSVAESLEAESLVAPESNAEESPREETCSVVNMEEVSPNTEAHNERWGWASSSSSGSKTRSVSNASSAIFEAVKSFKKKIPEAIAIADLAAFQHKKRPSQTKATGSKWGLGRVYALTMWPAKNITQTAFSITKKNRKVRFHLQEASYEGKKGSKTSSRTALLLKHLHRLGTLWNNFNLATAIICTWELFAWPFRMALGPDNEYEGIRMVFRENTLHLSSMYDVLLVVNIAMDFVFILDVLLKLVGSAVKDHDDLIDKGKEAKRAQKSRMKGWQNKEGSRGGPRDLPTLHYGPRSWAFLKHELPLYLLGTILSYVPYIVEVSYGLMLTLQLPRLSRMTLLFHFIREKELDVYFKVRKLAFFKFCLIVIGVSHWNGCTFYWMSRIQGFPDTQHWDTWVHQFETDSGVPFVRESASAAEKYMVIMYRGLSSISNMAYEPLAPRRIEELLFCIFSIVSQLFLEAYVLGTIFHYLVKKDIALEEYTTLMTRVHGYCASRNLPKSLHNRLISYFAFQKSKNTQDDSKVVNRLPMSLKIKYTQNKYRTVFERNSLLFRGCNAQFLHQIAVRFREVYLMPGETILRQREMPRELCFVKQGIIEAARDGEVVRRIRHDSESQTVLGEVAFFMGIAQPEAMSAVNSGDVTLVVFSKLAYEDLMENYPEQHDIILTNLLAQYDFDKNGNEMGRKKAIDDEDDSYKELHQAIQAAIQKRNADALSTITYAASNGDVDTVRNLLARGVPINQGDYDDRTTLHLAASEGNLRVVELLLQEGADPNVKDRWDGTPLSDAISNKQTPVVELLQKYDGVLTFKQPASMLCGAAAVDDISMMESFLSNGVEANCCDYDQRTALHLAASEGMLRVAEFLTRSGANVNCVDRWGNTPLVDAVRGGHDMLIKLLKGRSGVLPPSFGGSQLCQSCADGDIHSIELLLEAGVDVNTVDYDNRTALHVAASAGQASPKRIFLASKAFVVLYELTCACVFVSQLISVYFLLCKNANISIQDRWMSTPLQDSLESGHLNCAQLLLSFGGQLGDSGTPDALDVLNSPSSPAIADVWSRIGEINGMISGSAHKRSLVSTNLDEVVAFNRTVLLGMVNVIHDIREKGTGIFQQLRMMQKNLLSLFEFFQLLMDEGSANAKGADQHSSIQGGRDKECVVDLQALPAPREQKRPTIVTQLHFPGVVPPQPAIGPLIGIFDNFDAMLEAERMAEECQNNPGSSFEKRLDEHRDGTLDTRGRDIHRLLLKFGPVEATLGILQDILVRAAAQPPLEAVGSILMKLGVHCSDLIISRVCRDVKRSPDDLPSDLIGGISVPGLLSSVAFEEVICTKQTRSKSRHGLISLQGASEAYLAELQSAMTTMRGMFNVFDHTNDGHIGAKSVGALKSHIGPLLAEIMQHGIERYGSLTEQKLTYRQFVACLILWLNLEKDEKEESESDSSDGTWSLQSPRPLAASDDEKKQLLPAQGESKKVGGDKQSFSAQRSGFSDFDAAYAHLNASKTPTEISSRSTLITFGHKLFRRIYNSIKLLCPPLKRWGKNDELIKVFLQADKDRSNKIDKDEFSQMVTQLLEGQEKKATQEEIDKLFGMFDHNGSGFITYQDFVAVAKDAKNLAVLIQPGNEIQVRGRWRIDPSSTWLRYWDELAIRYLAIGYFFEVPFNISFQASKVLGQPYFIFQHFMDVLLWIDICLNFFRPYINEFSVVEIDLKRIKWNYLGSNFILDLVTAFPLDLLVFSDGATHSYIAWLRAFGTDNIPENAHVLEQYVLSFYWAIATISTNGQIGEGTARTYTEIAFTCVMILVSITLYVYVLGELSDLVMTQDMKLVATRGQVQTIQNFIEASNVPEDLSREISKHFEIISKRNTDQGDSTEPSSDIISRLSHSLQVEIARNISHTLVENCFVFSGCDENFIDSFCVLLREVTVPPENYLFRMNEVGKELYIIAKGCVEMTNDDEVEGEVVLETLEHGMVVGELGFFFGMRHTMHAKVAFGHPSTLFGLDKNDYQQLAKLYPEAEEQILRNILEFWDGAGKSSRGSMSAREVQSAHGQKSNRGSAMRSGRGQDNGSSNETINAIRAMLKVARQKKHNERVVCLISAAAANDIEEVRRLFAGADVGVDEGDYDKRTPLHLAASNNHLSMVKHLVIVHGADINVVDRYGGTPISDAVVGRHAEVASFLRQQGATLQLNDPASEICQAVSDGDLDYVKMLVDNGIDANVADYDSRSPLHLAAANGQLEILKYLCGIPSINVNPVDRIGGTPLQDAVRHRHKECQILLRDVGAHFGEMDVSTILCTAGAENDMEMVQTLYDSGVDMNCTDYDFRTALHLAASNGSLEVASFLLQTTGIDINPIDRKLCTPLEDAIRHNETVVQALLENAGGLCGNHPSLADKAAKNNEKQQKQIETNLLNRASRLVEATAEYGLIKKLESVQNGLERHTIDLQQNCLAYFDSLNVMVDAAASSIEVCLEDADKRAASSQKHISFRVKELQKILEGTDAQECFEFPLVRKVAREVVTLAKDMTLLLPKFEELMKRVVEAGQTNGYYFEGYQEEIIRRKIEKRQAKMKKKIGKQTLARSSTISDGQLPSPVLYY